MNPDNYTEEQVIITKNKATHFKNVLFVGPHYNQLGGIASVLEVYARSIPGFNFISSYHKKNATYNVFYFIRSLFKFVFRLISEKEIKIVHIHSAVRGSFFRKSIFLLLAKLFGKKAILHIHSGFFKKFYTENKRLQPFIKYILNKADVLVCLSDEWKLYYDSLIKNKKIVVINNPVLLPANMQQHAWGTPLKILFLNRIVVEKGIFDLVNFFNINKSWLTGSFKLIVAGAGNAENDFKTMVAENNLSDLIEFKGLVTGKEKDEIIKDCDLFILTSYYEGLPMSILEAMSFGKPIIASNVGGIPSVVKAGKNGWVVEAGDTKDLIKVFQEIKNNPGLLNAYSEHSFHIVRDYSPEKVKESLNSLYETLL
jgi:glycosyltransferase involved in cell wall biosynthesis